MPRMYRNADKVEMHIRKRQTFKIGNVSGDWYSADSPPRWGILPDEFKTTMRILLQDRDLYVIHSYLTPIAYAYDKTLYIPDVNYSASTKGHQDIVRSANNFGTLPA